MDIHAFMNMDAPQLQNSPLQAVTKMVPVPENLMSPDYRPLPIAERIKETQNFKNNYINKSQNPNKMLSSNIKSQINQSTQNDRISSPNRPRKIIESNIRVQKKAEINNEKVQKAAVFIQKIWRGYYTRNKDKCVEEKLKMLQRQRSYEYIQKLATDMETTKAALESERKIQMLQTEAIGAMWKKISSLQGATNDDLTASTSNINITDSADSNSALLRQLIQTCSNIQDQMQQIQKSMLEIANTVANLGKSGEIKINKEENYVATQTEMVSVQTPPDDTTKISPFRNHHSLQHIRPSSLPLPINQRKKENAQSIQANNELGQFAGTLLDGVIRTVSGTGEHLDTDLKTTETKENKNHEGN